MASVTTTPQFYGSIAQILRVFVFMHASRMIVPQYFSKSDRNVRDVVRRKDSAAIIPQFSGHNCKKTAGTSSLAKRRFVVTAICYANGCVKLFTAGKHAIIPLTKSRDGKDKRQDGRDEKDE